jgi:hypothetical protein
VAVSSRACGALTLITPRRQEAINATHIETSTHRGIALRTGGANVAVTMPVNKAIENCRKSGTPMHNKTRNNRQVLARSVRGLGRNKFRSNLQTLADLRVV